MKYVSALLLSFGVIAQGHSAHPLDQWSWRNPLPSGNTLLGITFASDRFVAVGEAGTILTSTNAQDWVFVNSPSRHSLHAIAHGAGTFVAVGDNGAILTSTDAQSWTLRTSPTANHLHAVTYGNGTFVATANGMVLRSPDGVTWTAANTDRNFGSIAFGNGKFAATDGSSEVSMSNDGLAWTRAALTVGSYFPALRTVTFGNGNFIIGSVVSSRLNLSVYAFVSPDGTTWSANPVRSLPFGAFAAVPVIVCGPSECFLLPAGMGDRLFCFSINGSTWTNHWIADYDGGPFAGTFGGGTYAIVGRLGHIATSADGRNWIERRHGVTPNLESVTFGNGVSVAVGHGTFSQSDPALNGPGILKSLDNLSYHPVAFTGSLSSVSYGSDCFVAVGGAGSVFRSVDGSNWVQRTSGTSDNLLGITFGGPGFVTVGGRGTIRTSPDGRIWTARSSPAGDSLLSAVVFAQSRYIAVGVGGTIITSTNGADWTLEDSPTLAHLWGVAGSPDRLVAVGDAGTIVTFSSPTGWTIQSEGLPRAYYATVAYGGGHFLVAGSEEVSAYAPNVVLTSIDGVDWTPRNVGTRIGIRGSAFIRDRFIIVGRFGAILESGVNSLLLTARQSAAGAELLITGGAESNVCHVEMSTSLTPGSWTPFATFTNYGSAHRIVDTSASSRQRSFYRIRNTAD